MFDEKFLDQLASAIVARLPEPASEASPLPACDDLKMLKVYTYEEVKDILGISGTTVQGVTTISEALLPRTRRTPGRKGILGIHILCYMAGRPPIAVSEILDQRVNELKKIKKSRTYPLRQNGKTIERVI